MTLTELTALLEKATPAPWKYDLDRFDDDNGIQACVTNDGVTLLATIATDVNFDRGDETKPWTAEQEAAKNAAWAKAKESQAAKDAALIAAFRNAAPDLLKIAAAVAALRFPENESGWPLGRYCPVCGKFTGYEGEQPDADEDCAQWTEDRWAIHHAAVNAREQAAIDAIKHTDDCAWVIAKRLAEGK